ncbi:MAG: DUF4276 family protein [Methylococcaceae bacterium]
MTRYYVICEGQSEETFIRDVLAPILADQKIYLTPLLVPTSRNSKGGAFDYARVKPFIIKSLKKEKNAFVTTLFDLYALDKHFPNFEQSQKCNNVYEKVECLEKALYEDIAKENSNLARYFIPYIQPYEFEALLFSDVEKLVTVEPNWTQFSKQLKTIRDEFETPEHINNSYETKPSARLDKLLNNPNYRKTYHGASAIKAIGIHTLLAECHHFADWYKKLCQLNN